MRVSTLLVTLGAMAALLFTLFPAPTVSAGDTAALAASTDYTVRERITILGNDNFTAENGVVSGSGGSKDPYIIEGWEIVFNNSGTCISVTGTDKHFIIRNVHLIGALTGVRFDKLDHGRVTETIIEHCAVGVSAAYADLSSVDHSSISNCSVGISLRYCDEFDLDHNVMTDNKEDLRVVALPWITTRQANLVFAVIVAIMAAFIGALVYMRIRSGRPPEEKP